MNVVADCIKTNKQKLHAIRMEFFDGMGFYLEDSTASKEVYF